MIAGIGTDVIETERMRSAILRHGDHFLAHVFTPAEIAAAPVGPARDPYFAARWAAKEAEQGGEPNPHRPDSVAAPTTPAS